MSVGTQTGAASSGKAAPPLVPFGLGPDGHFQFASMVQSVGTPFEIEPIVDDDLAFASFTSAAGGLDIRKIRTHSLKILEELGRRWWCVTEALVSCQPWEVKMATSGRHIALIGLLAIMIDWPDPGIMKDLVQGFPGVGYSKHVPVYASQPASWIPLNDLWTTAMDDAKRICDRLRPGDFDDAIMEAGAKDENLGFCGPRMSWDDLCSFDRPFRLIRRFCIQQPGGKLRVIDDAADGGQSALSSDGNKLDLCTAVQPGLHVRLLWRDFIARDPRWFDDDGFESGGEDLPHAYRHVPMIPSESWACIVAYYDRELESCAFRRYFGMLFGLPLAVTSFNRFPRFQRVSDASAHRCHRSTLMIWLSRTFAVQKVQVKPSVWHWPNFWGLLSQKRSTRPWPKKAISLVFGIINVGDAVLHGGVTFWIRHWRQLAREPSPTRCGLQAFWLPELPRPWMLGEDGSIRPDSHTGETVLRRFRCICDTGNWTMLWHGEGPPVFEATPHFVSWPSLLWETLGCLRRSSGSTPIRISWFLGYHCRQAKTRLCIASGRKALCQLGLPTSKNSSAGAMHCHDDTRQCRAVLQRTTLCMVCGQCGCVDGTHSRPEQCSRTGYHGGSHSLYLVRIGVFHLLWMDSKQGQLEWRDIQGRAVWPLAPAVWIRSSRGRSLVPPLSAFTFDFDENLFVPLRRSECFGS